ncbi:enoyl-CoA hydratase/isomerase family protein [Luminiphilus sp.]|nr:enoyl-CoA hydratase/isomerase family protein [Luminiphilus sp.]
MSDVVLVSTIGEGDCRVGRLTLNTPRILNSLDAEMIEIMLAKLLEWAEDDSIAAVYIDGEGEKAFCAGGDVHELRRSSMENPGGPCTYAENFFAREYQMNYVLFTYPKPVICWGHGVVMGGGMGVMAGCSHRVVSERTRIGMPEITIALFPDVGGSYFLNRTPGMIGRFLSLTSAHINATDALYANLGDVFLAHEQRHGVIEALAKGPWADDPAVNTAIVDDILSMEAALDQPLGVIEPLMPQINALMAGDDLNGISDRLLGYEGDNVWLQKARDGFAHGSKLAACWIFRQLNESANYSLKEVFDTELRLGANIMRHPEFAEGVRALLVDKDRQPKWQFATVQDVPMDVLESFFAEPLGAPNMHYPW